jgi:2-methylcitrate dehydratase PrpD
LTENLGNPFLITKNFFKRYACCRACFEGIEGVRQLLIAHGLKPGAVEKITVTMKPARTWLVANPAPQDIYQAKFSLPFCMAVTALRGEAGLFQFTEENLQDPLVREFMQKVSLVNDPAIASKGKDRADRCGPIGVDIGAHLPIPGSGRSEGEIPQEHVATP